MDKKSYDLRFFKDLLEPESINYSAKGVYPNAIKFLGLPTAIFENDVLDSMKCGMCRQFLLDLTDVHACIGVQGHFICHHCFFLYKSLTQSMQSLSPRLLIKCPCARKNKNYYSTGPHLCGLMVRKTNILPLKALFDKITFECKFRSVGCLQILNGQEMATHMENCDHRKLTRCHISNCELSHVPFVMYLEHLVKEHGIPMVTGSSAILTIPYLSLDFTKRSYYGRILASFRALDKQFLIMLREDEDDIWIYAVHIDPSANIECDKDSEPQINVLYEINAKTRKGELGAYHKSAVVKVISLEESFARDFPFNREFAVSKFSLLKYFMNKIDRTWAVEVTFKKFMMNQRYSGPYWQWNYNKYDNCRSQISISSPSSGSLAASP